MFRAAIQASRIRHCSINLTLFANGGGFGLRSEISLPCRRLCRGHLQVGRAGRPQGRCSLRPASYPGAPEASAQAGYTISAFGDITRDHEALMTNRLLCLFLAFALLAS